MINFSSIQNALNQTMAPVLADQLNNRVQILRLLNKSIAGGKNIAWDVKVATNHLAASYVDGATVNGGASVTNTKIPAILQWKLNKAEFSVSGLALSTAITAGPAAVANLFRDEIADAARDLAVSLSTQLYGDGTGNSGADIDGLGAAVLDTGTYAGIARATYSTWRGYVSANGGTPRALSKALMDAAEAAVFRASGFAPNVIVTTPEVVIKYEALFDSIKRQDTLAPVFDVGARSVTYKGIPIIRDARCPAGKMFFLTQESMSFVQLPPLAMAEGMELVDGFAPIVDPDGNVGLQVGIELLGKTGDKVEGFVKVYGNLQVRNPNMNAVIVDINEA